TNTRVGPSSVLPVPRMASLADGTVVIGPKPQVKSLMPELTGEKNSDSLMSPTPFVLLSITGLGWAVTGTIVREMTFHCEPKLIGTTGSMLRTFCVRPNGPLLKLLLFWNGTVTRDAIGFCDALARSSSVPACRPFARAEPTESSGVRVASSELPLTNL